MSTQPPTPECGECGSQGDLGYCGGCKLGTFCSLEHRKAKGDACDAICSRISKCIENVDSEERLLKQELESHPNLKHPSHIISQIDADEFPDISSRCYCLIVTQSYMFARFCVIKEYRRANTTRSLQLACNMAVESQYLSRCDNMCIRSITANLFIRRNRLQSAYDFIKWWLVNGDFYDCQANPPQPFLDIRRSAAVEPVCDLIQAFFKAPGRAERLPVVLLLALTLIKFKLLADFKNLRNLQILREKLPYDIIYCTKRLVSSNEYTDTNPGIFLADNIGLYETIIRMLEFDLEYLFHLCGKSVCGDAQII
ncbi:hypothetical protein ABW20_dc0110333 [Dactylellina cionopaga]|nr:hypothetical protein ABW20_dc0110333 [Dactylellina cionopaga]